jgi:seryl-tRNA synthetase
MPISSTKELEQSVDNFLSNDDKIRNLRKQINGLVSERNRYQDQIISHLQQTNANTIQIENTVLRKNKTENKSAITYDLFKQVIYDEVADPVLITKIIMNMDSKRKVKSYMNIKREFRPEQP